MKIAIIEDEPKIAESLKSILNGNRPVNFCNEDPFKC